MAARGIKEGLGGLLGLSRRDNWQACRVARLAGAVPKSACAIIGRHHRRLGSDIHPSFSGIRIINRGLAREAVLETSAAFRHRPYKPRFNKRRAAKTRARVAAKAAAQALMLLPQNQGWWAGRQGGALTHGGPATAVMNLHSTGYQPQGADDQPGMDIVQSGGGATGFVYPQAQNTLWGGHVSVGQQAQSWQWPPAFGQPQSIMGMGVRGPHGWGDNGGSPNQQPPPSMIGAQGVQQGIWPSSGPGINISMGAATGLHGAGTSGGYIDSGAVGVAMDVQDESCPAPDGGSSTAGGVSGMAAPGTAAVEGQQDIDVHTMATSSMTAEEYMANAVIPFRDGDGHAAAALVGAGVVDQAAGDYANLRKLGNGAFGSVYDARKVHSVVPLESTGEQRYRARLWNQPVALKAIPLEALNPATNLPDNYAWVHREIEGMRELRGHPNIVELLDTFVCKPAEEGGWPKEVYVVMERAQMTLADAAYDYELTEAHVKSYTYQTASALRHIHSLGYSHFDIKLENLLLMGDHLVKITDFGVCSHTRHNIEPYGRGTFDCGAPEFHLDLPMGQPADLWSFGVTIYELITRSVPFYVADENTWLMIQKQAVIAGLPASDHVWPEGMATLRACEGFCAAHYHYGNDQSRLYEVLLSYWQSRKPELIELFLKTWAFVPSQRGSFEDILRLPWFHQMDPFTRQPTLAPETCNPSILPPLVRRAAAAAEAQPEQLSPFARPASPATMPLERPGPTGQAASSEPAVDAGQVVQPVLSEVHAAPTLPDAPAPVHAARDYDASVKSAWGPPTVQEEAFAPAPHPATSTVGEEASGFSLASITQMGRATPSDVGSVVKAPAGEEPSISSVDVAPPLHDQEAYGLPAEAPQLQGSLPYGRGMLATDTPQPDVVYEDHAQPAGGSKPGQELRSNATSLLHDGNLQTPIEHSSSEEAVELISPHFESRVDDRSTYIDQAYQALSTDDLGPSQGADATRNGQDIGQPEAPSKESQSQGATPTLLGKRAQGSSEAVASETHAPTLASLSATEPVPEAGEVESSGGGGAEGEYAAPEARCEAHAPESITSDSGIHLSQPSTPSPQGAHCIPVQTAPTLESNEGAALSDVAASHGQQASAPAAPEAPYSSPEGPGNDTLSHAVISSTDDLLPPAGKPERHADGPILAKRARNGAEATDRASSRAAVESGATGEGSEASSSRAAPEREAGGHSAKKRRRGQDASDELGPGTENQQQGVAVTNRVQHLEAPGVKRLADSKSSGEADVSSAGEGATGAVSPETGLEPTSKAVAGGGKRKRSCGAAGTSTVAPTSMPKLAMHETSTFGNAANVMATATNASVPLPAADTASVKENSVPQASVGTAPVEGKTAEEEDTPSQPHKRARPAEPSNENEAAAPPQVVEEWDHLDGFGDDL